jgi:hypothetical protein
MCPISSSVMARGTGQPSIIAMALGPMISQACAGSHCASGAAPSSGTAALPLRPAWPIWMPAGMSWSW